MEPTSTSARNAYRHVLYTINYAPYAYRCREPTRAARGSMGTHRTRACACEKVCRNCGSAQIKTTVRYRGAGTT